MPLSGPLFPGFQLDKDKEGFVRTIAEGRQEILVPFVDRSPRFVFGLTLCIRLDPVEDICNRFNEAAARYHRQTVTTITPLSYFGRDRYAFSTPEELRAAIDDIASIAGELLRFMDRHQDVCALQRSMEANGPHFDISVEPGHAMRAVALARLCPDADFKSISAREVAASQAWALSDRDTLLALIASLE